MNSLADFNKFIGVSVDFSIDGGKTWFKNRKPYFIGLNPGNRFCITTEPPERALIYCDPNKFKIRFNNG